MSSTLPVLIAPVDNRGTSLSYQDTGALSQAFSGSDSYTTLVLVHGAIFHGGVFNHLFPYAAANNIRLVAVTLRDYARSTRFSPVELDALRSSDVNVQASAIKACGHELAYFLEEFIRKEQIPPLSVTSAGRTGGISLLGWSWGNSMTLSLLGNADSLPAGTRDFLGKYLRTNFLLNAPPVALGAPRPALNELWHPSQDPTIPAKERPKRFTVWASGYFPHSAQVVSSIATVDRTTLFQGLARDPSSDPPPTLQSVSAKDLAAVSDDTVYARSQVLMEKVDPSVYQANTHKALAAKDHVWPGVRNVYIWGDRSLGSTVYTAWYFAGLLKSSWPSDGRPVEFKRLEGSNHYPFWDEPERTLKYLVSLI